MRKAMALLEKEAKGKAEAAPPQAVVTSLSGKGGVVVTSVRPQSKERK